MTLPQAEFVPMLSQDMGPHALGPALPQVHVIITHCNLHTATHSTVSPLHTYGQCESQLCVFGEMSSQPSKMFCCSWLLLCAQESLVCLLEAHSTCILALLQLIFPLNKNHMYTHTHTHTANFSQKHLEQLIVSNFTLWGYILGFLSFPLPENNLKVIPSFLDV